MPHSFISCFYVSIAYNYEYLINKSASQPLKVDKYDGRKKSKEFLKIVVVRIRVKMRVLDSGLQPGLDSYLKTVIVFCVQ